MTGVELLQQAIDSAQSTMTAVPESQRKDMELLIEDLEESKTTIFVRTAEAKPMIERCVRAAEILKTVVDSGGWTEDAPVALEQFERGVSKLRNTILVRTQRAT